MRYVVLFEPGTAVGSAGREMSARCGTLAAYYPSIGVGVVDSADRRFERLVGTDRAYSAEAEQRERAAADGQSTALVPGRANVETWQGPVAAPSTAGSAGATPADAMPDTAGSADATPATAAPATGTAAAPAGGWNAAAVHAPEAHAVTTGSADVVVGVLDSGVDGTHPELAAAFDRSRSADCLSPARPDRSPEARSAPHGTHVAGIVAAADDGVGTTGVAPGVRVASVRVVDEAGYVNPEYAVCGFMWAAEHGIRVVNSSFLVDAAARGCTGEGSAVPREAVRRAVEHATSRGVLTVAAVGNERIDLSAVRRPDCDAVPVGLDDVVAVSAVGHDGVKAGYSSYGLGSVDITAPGGESRVPGHAGCVLSTVPGADYDRACGTSMAAPHVSGVAALLASRHPDAGPRELTRMLLASTSPMSCPSDYDLNSDSAQDALCRGYAAYNGFYGHGMVDARRAVTR
ncbi:secreted subtilisin-like protease [Saccharopolyspora erythraea NRRL 2338]|uniref:Secreted subtilisin-like protease n=1 Tax=Saccharopolyspora erythraea (strain ATCC 11635 / DSM 40517 / JCM 4748 / NBRC 13426 / NCIMB 8594 / NRRL 2338) TaxID=405948 RepID=A4F9K1_SACEN|nr:secreted subtilisin-like protease [Saccharopolyspora erythraea NRRL 2338]